VKNPTLLGIIHNKQPIRRNDRGVRGDRSVRERERERERAKLWQTSIFESSQQ
jgi:hypothetical protein